MRLSVSNLAFSNGFDESFYKALANHDYKFVDIAPTKLWPNWEYTDPGASHIRAMLSNYEIQAAGMQHPDLEQMPFLRENICLAKTCTYFQWLLR